MQSEERTLVKSRKLKHGLMEDLLTGKVPVTDLPQDVEELQEQMAARDDGPASVP